jgi:hypothetical protein
MRLKVSTSAFLVVLPTLVLCAGTRAHAQSTAASTAGTAAYVSTDPLAGVRYDNRFDLSLGAAYGHIKAGPPPLEEGSNLGGLDLSGSAWFTRNLGLEGTARSYMGSSGAGLGPGNTGNLVKGPFVAQYMFAAGPEWLGPHNKHGALTVHALFGGAHFISHTYPLGPESVWFFNNQTAPAAIIGGHIDLNRSPRWVLRFTPDAMYTRYGINYAGPHTYWGNTSTYAYWNFGLSVGLEYKFKRLR